MNAEAEIGVMPPQAKEHQEPQKPEAAGKDSPLQPLEGVWPQCQGCAVL